MRFGILFSLLLVASPVFAQNMATTPASEDKAVLIKDIQIQGFVLGDRDQFIRLFRPYRNKHLTTSDMNGILERIQEIYNEGGYQELVSIGYQVTRRRLIFTVTLIK